MTLRAMTDLDYMIEALKEAELAYENGESPVGAVMVYNGEIIARAGNQVYRLHDPTAHAEIQVIRQAGQQLNKVCFPDCVLYTTMQPCPMCENALIQAKVPKVVFGGSGFKHIYERNRIIPYPLHYRYGRIVSILFKGSRIPVIDHRCCDVSDRSFKALHKLGYFAVSQCLGGFHGQDGAKLGEPALFN